MDICSAIMEHRGTFVPYGSGSKIFHYGVVTNFLKAVMHLLKYRLDTMVSFWVKQSAQAAKPQIPHL